MAVVPTARFDSLGVGADPGSYRFAEPIEEVVAWTVAEVAPTIQRVEVAVASGAHAAGFIAYEASPGFDPALAVQTPAEGIPLLWFGIFGARIETHTLSDLPEGESGYVLGALARSLDQDAYAERVRRILGLIAAGDTYQVNFTFRLRGAFKGDDRALYRDLCRAQRSSFCAHLQTDHGTVISASPELFFRREGDLIEMRPMKGTRGRGRWSGEDDEISRSLESSPKDRAENLMIVDLLRNDLGRIAEYGSVSVPRLFQVERYPTVHQLTSTVTARPRDDVGLLDTLRALFPSGSVTGAPKVRTSQIIRDLEDSPRGVYTGAVGFVSPDRTVFSVAIRTVWLDRSAGTIEIGIGSGVTADSHPVEEYEECVGKGAFLTLRTPEFRLLESLRLDADGEYALLDLHMDRLLGSARYFDLPLEEAAVRSALREAARRCPPALYKVRLLVGQDGTIETDVEQIPATLPVARLGLVRNAVDPRDVFLYHKTTHRPPGTGPGAIPPGCDDVVLTNDRGELTETAWANIVLDLDGDLFTPPVDSGILPGTMRRQLLADGVIRERVLTVKDLELARRILLINSVRGWREGRLVGFNSP